MHFTLRTGGVLSSFLLASAFSSTAAAAFSQQPVLSVSAVFANADSSRNIDDDGSGFRLSIGKLVGTSTLLELQAGTNDYDDGSNDLEQINIGVDANFLFNVDARVQPYLLLGLGYQENESNSNNLKAEGAYADIGVGVFSQLSDGGVSLRADLRLRRDFHDDINQNSQEFDDLIAHIGLSFPLGSNASNSDSKPRPSNPKTDTDRDGVNDIEDYCPGTTPHAAVDRTGCSRKQNGETATSRPTLLAPPRATTQRAPTPVPGAAPAQTTAAATPAPAKQTAKQTPPAESNTATTTETPKAETSTPVAAPVASGNQTIGPIPNPATVTFTPGSTVLSNDSKVLIAKIASKILSDNMRVEITGGGEQQRAKTIRAKSVAQQLLGHRVPASRILINNSRYSEQTLIRLQRQ